MPAYLLSRLFFWKTMLMLGGQCSPATAYSPLPMKYRDAGYAALSGLLPNGYSHKCAIRC